MSTRNSGLVKSYQDPGFINSREARPLRILSEYIEPEARFEQHGVRDTIVFFGSARAVPLAEAEAALKKARNKGSGVERAEAALRMARYYEDARELAHRLTDWSKGLSEHDRRFVVCTGGGPGIMEAANRGASEARGLNVGLSISLPHEQAGNRYTTRQLAFHFHYFFMRKFWFAYLAKAVVAMPGGMGTLDELFELLTLVQTRKVTKPMPVVLFGTEFWDAAVDFDVFAEYGTVGPGELDFVFRTDSVDEAYDYLTRELAEHALNRPGPTL